MEIFIVLFFVSTLSGIVDVVIGSGSLVSLPYLSHLGLSGSSLVATNRLPSLCGIVNSFFQYYRKGMIKISEYKIPAIMSLIGAILGAIVNVNFNNNNLSLIIYIIIISLSVIFISQDFILSRLSTVRKFYNFIIDRFFIKIIKKTTRTDKFSTNIAFFLIGLYSGFIGIGSGMLLVIVLRKFANLDIVGAISQSKLFELINALVSTFVFFGVGCISYELVLPMIVGQVIGSRLGVLLTVKVNSKLISLIIRTLLLFVIFYISYKIYAIYF